LFDFTPPNDLPIAPEISALVFITMSDKPKYLTGDVEGIKEFLDRFDVSAMPANVHDSSYSGQGIWKRSSTTGEARLMLFAGLSF